jgi:hypothetical protein
MSRVVAAVLLVTFGHGIASADECEDRLAWIDTRLAATAHDARVWSWGWGIGLGAMTVGSLAAVPLVDDEEEVDWYVGAATSFVGLVPLVVLPLQVMDDADTLAARRRTGERCAVLLPEAERFLARDAANQEEGRAWWMHAANLAVNGGAGLLLWLGYDHATSGALTFVVGAGIGEVMIFTQPTGSVSDLARYRAGVVPIVGHDTVGLAVTGAF